MAGRAGALVQPGEGGDPARGARLAPEGHPARGGHPGRVRLSRSADFDRVFRHGRSYGCRELVLYVFPRGDESGAPRRLGLSVSRKVGGAVQRNRVKRLIREAYAVESSGLPPGSDAVVVARPEARGLAEREGLAGVQRVLADLIGRATGEGTRARRRPDGKASVAHLDPAGAE